MSIDLSISNESPNMFINLVDDETQEASKSTKNLVNSNLIDRKDKIDSEFKVDMDSKKMKMIIPAYQTTMLALQKIMSNSRQQKKRTQH